MPAPIPNMGKSVAQLGAQKMRLWCESASVMLTIFIIQSLSAVFFLFGAHFRLSGARTTSNMRPHFTFPIGIRILNIESSILQYCVFEFRANIDNAKDAFFI